MVEAKRYRGGYRDKIAAAGMCRDHPTSRKATRGVYCDECAEKNRVRASAWYKENRQFVIDAQKIKKYGTLPTESCEVCGSTNRLVVDHNHETGATRGTLCGKCNTALGMANDSVERLAKLILYLENH